MFTRLNLTPPGKDQPSKSETTPDGDHSPAIVPPRVDPAAIEEVRVLTDKILAAPNPPKSLLFAGAPPHGFLTFTVPSFGPAVLLFTNGHHVIDYLAVTGAEASICEFKTDDLPELAKAWAASGTKAWILNRCPRCAVALTVDIATLWTKDGFLKEIGR